MIVELVQRQGSIFAVNNVGDLILWLTSPRKLSSSYRFDHNISLVPSSVCLKISKSELLGMAALQRALVAFSRSSLFVIDANKLTEMLDQGTSDVIKQIKLMHDLQQNEKITCLAAVDQQNLVLGTNRNHLYLYNLTTQKFQAKKSLNQQKTQDLTLFAANSLKASEITAIAMIKDQQLLFVGCENGKVLTVDALRLQIINEITQNTKTPLEKVSKLYFPTDKQKLYSIHQNYVIEWNYKLNVAQSCYQFPNGTGIVHTDETLYLGGSTNSLFRIKQQISYLGVSMRSVEVMKEIGSNLFAVGGSDNLVDVFQNGMRLMTLFKR